MTPTIDFSALKQLQLWLNLSEDEQDAVVKNLEQWLGGEYVHQYTLSYSDNPSLRVPTFRNLPTGLEFNLIIGGQFNMGLSVQEEEVFLGLIEEDEEVKLWFDRKFIDSMRPVHTVLVRPFLMSRFPILNYLAREHLGLNLDDFISEYEVDPDDEQKLLPASLNREQINVIIKKIRFDLPSEAQWEYAYRGGTSTLFYWGDDFLRFKDEYMLCEFSDREKCKEAANPFGLVGLCVGEWCKNSYCPDYSNASENDLPLVAETRNYVMRGGAAYVWPWQNCGEWISCVSAMRYAAECDEFAAGRLVKVLDLNDELADK